MATDEQIKDHLLESDLPVPSANISSSPISWWFGVAYLLFFVSLFLLMIGSTNILHDWIDKPLLTASSTSTTGISASYYDFIADYYLFTMIPLIQFYIPAIIISYLVALFFAIFLKRQEVRHPFIKETKIYKILLSTAVITAFLYMISELITAGYGYLSGDPVSYTLRHALVIVLTPGIVFVYCTTEINHWRIKFNKELLAFIYITFFAVIALMYGFKIIPSASMERAITNDHKRIIDIGQIADSIVTYYQTNSQLPVDLNALTSNTDSPTAPLIKVDPETFQSYQYSITGSSTYKICASFSTASSKDDPSGYDDATGDYSLFKTQFIHPAGYHCFDEDADNSGLIPSPACLGSDCPDLSPVPTYPSEVPSTPTPFPASNTGGAL